MFLRIVINNVYRIVFLCLVTEEILICLNVMTNAVFSMINEHLTHINLICELMNRIYFYLLFRNLKVEKQVKVWLSYDNIMDEIKMIY